MADVQIIYVNKTANEHERIVEVGNDAGMWPVSLIVNNIENRIDTFFTLDAAGNRADIYVRQGIRGKFIQTVADGNWANNLLSLPPRRAA